MLSTLYLMPSQSHQGSASPDQLPQLLDSAGHPALWNIPLSSLGQLSWTRSLQALCHLLDSRVWDMESLQGPCRVLEEGNPCLATTKLSTCDPQHSYPASKPSALPVPGKKGIPLKSRTVGTLKTVPWENPNLFNSHAPKKI